MNIKNSTQLSLWLLSGCIALFSPAHAANVTDDFGLTVSLNKPAKRIISLSPHATELLYAAGASQQIIGTVDYSDYPEKAKKIPRIGNSSALDIEALTALNPDLIVVWGSGTNSALIEQLRQLNFSIFISEPTKLDNIAENILSLSTLMGTLETGKKSHADFIQKLTELRQKYSHLKKVSVFYQLWEQPLMTFNGEHLTSQVIELCGGENIFSTQDILASIVSKEAVIQSNPTIILAAANDNNQNVFSRWRQWSQLSAVSHKNLFLINADLLHRASPRILLGAETVCRAIDIARNKK